MDMGEIRVFRFTWTVQTCRGEQADFCLVSCSVLFRLFRDHNSCHCAVWQL